MKHRVFQWIGDMSLLKRMRIWSLGMLIIIQWSGFAVVRSGIEENAQTQLSSELEIAERVWRKLLDQNAQKLQISVNGFIQDDGLQTAVAAENMPRAQMTLNEQANRVGAGSVVLLDSEWKIKASAKTIQSLNQEKLVRIAQKIKEDAVHYVFASIDQKPYQFVMSPIRTPRFSGWVLMGFAVDQAMVDGIFQLLSVHLAVVVEPESTEGFYVAATTLSEFNAGQAALFSRQPYATIELNHQLFMGRLVKLSQGGGVSSVLMRSISEVLKPYVRLQILLAIITVLAMVLFTASTSTALRLLTQPLIKLLKFTQLLEKGIYNAPLPALNRAHEIGQLARALDLMRTSIMKHQSEIERMAFWDRLTGLPNREQFRKAIETFIKNRPSSEVRHVSVITLNLNRFKHVNDVLGYEFGDELLCAVAKRLLALTNQDAALLARLGSDNFGLLLYNTQSAQAFELVHRIHHQFEMPVELNGHMVDVNACMGVACYPDHADASDLLLSRSEIAMHMAKEKATLVVLFDPLVESISTENLSLLSDLKSAIEQYQLRLYLQPKISAQTAVINGAEALIRWNHPMRGIISSMHFVPFAEKTGFIRLLTLWIFEETARQWHSVQPSTHMIQIAVNLSARDLIDPDLPAKFQSILAQYQVPIDGIALEITESAIMDDPTRSEQTLCKLAEVGFQISIDDFGAGHSSLAYLKRLPVHALKIDQSFIKAMKHSVRDQQIVRSTIELAHHMQLGVVAEGVEDETTYGLLKAWSCDSIQGYWISPPVLHTGFKQVCAQWQSFIGA